ncbi:hypothetical protein FAZ95_38905 [Trinickia violacea]|uniref:Uncharacterized protein n=1 Tax=Trinickia violacea TaxID=2571746 RepID=A0A4P8J4R7_9BURK|nr:TglA family RiPP precursor [Trinickia violacea]QCP55104.1 hypothetical protein FAZ95_38905 [Trinickia violacea]
MSNLPNDSVSPEATDHSLNAQAEAALSANAQAQDAEPGSCMFEDFNLDDIEVIESKVFA